MTDDLTSAHRRPHGRYGDARAWVARALNVLPRGRTLPPAAWERRHRVILTILWLHALAFPLAGAGRYDLPHTFLHALPLVVPALLGTFCAGRRLRSAMVAFGLLSSSALLVHHTGGLIESHFHFFAVILLLTLYEDWVPVLLAVGYVLLHHGVAGNLLPETVFDHADAQERPWLWAGIHALFVAAVGAAAVAGWRLNEDVRGETVRALQAARLSEERFRRSFDDAAIGMALTSTDGRFLRVNRSLCEMLGYPEEHLLGRSVQDFTAPEDHAISAGALRSGASGPLRLEKRYVRADGELIWTSLAASLIQPDGGEPYFISQIEDVTERKRAEEQARRAEERARRRESQQAALAELGQRALAGSEFRDLCEQALLTVTETLGTPYGRITKLSAEGDELERIAVIGWPETPQARAAGASQQSYTAVTGQPVIVEDIAAEQRFETMTLAAHGVVSGMSVAVVDEDSREAYVLDTHSTERRAFTPDDLNFLQAVRNVLGGAVERQRGELELRHRSLHDPLTGLANRLLFVERLQHALAYAERVDGTVALLFVDLDEFKVVNDGLGHEAGDALLRELGTRLAATLRECDTLSRFGGDEFVVLCEDLAAPEDAALIAERLRSTLASPVQLGSVQHVPAASIGVATATGAYPGGPEALLRDADAAMYRAKAAGGDRYEVFDELMRARLLDRLEIERGLPLALERGEFRLVYQPAIALDSGSARRVEALVRWDHPERGLVAPGDFISVAEASGLIVPIGDWVLREACRQAAAWRARGGHPDLADLRIAVNVSARQLARTDFTESVARALADTGLDPDALVLELTETALIEDPDRAEETILRLNEHGVRVSLDDFGTGYSSLESIKRYRLAAVKLDRSFVMGLEADSRDRAIVGAVVEMANAIGISTIAEGVETPQQLAQLRALGCEIAQGYLFSPPVDAVEFERLLRSDFARRFARGVRAA